MSPKNILRAGDKVIVVVVACLAALGVVTIVHLHHLLGASTTIATQVCTDFGTPTIVAPASGTSTNSDSVTVSGTADPGMTVAILDNGSGDGATTAAADGSYQIIVPIVVGMNALQATAANSCNFTRSSQTVHVTRIGPPVPPPAPTPKPTSPGPAHPSPGQTTQPIVSNLTPIVTPTSPRRSSNNVSPAPPVITQPKTGFTTIDPNIWVAGKASPGSVVLILVNGRVQAQVIAAADGTFGALVSLRPGLNSIQTEILIKHKSLYSATIKGYYHPSSPALPTHRSWLDQPFALGLGILAIIVVFVGVLLKLPAAKVLWKRLKK